MIRRFALALVLLAALGSLAVVAWPPGSNFLIGEWRLTEETASEKTAREWLGYRYLRFTDNEMHTDVLAMAVQDYHIMDSMAKVRTPLGETYVYERIADDLICLLPVDLEVDTQEDAAAATRVFDRICYRKV